MNARRFLTLFIVSLFFALAVPCQGWGGGSDIIVGSKGSISGTGPSSGKRFDSTVAFRPSHRIAAAPAQQPQEPQSWLSWVWNLLTSLWGEHLRPSGPTPF